MAPRRGDRLSSRTIGRDIQALAALRKPGLLRQVLGVCASSPAQVVSLQKIQEQMQDRGAIETIAHYLALLEERVSRCAPRQARREGGSQPRPRPRNWSP